MKLPAGFEETAQQRFKDAKNFSSKWRDDSRDEYAFIAGDQWEDEDVALLKEQGRPTVTFNYSEKMIDAVVGAEVTNRQEVRYLPVEVNDAALAEIWSSAAKWAREKCNAEDEETDAFRDALICGMGWTETYLSYDEELDGMIKVDRIDPLEMYWDTAARKQGLQDRRWDARLVWADEHELKQKYPQKFITAMDSADGGAGFITHGERYEDEQRDKDAHPGQIKVLQYECWYKGIVYRVLDPETGQMLEVDENTFNQQKDAIHYYNIQYVRQEKKIYYQAVFAGETMLEAKVSPIQCGFSRNCITGKRDRNKNTWYGLTRVMKDPQRWANKWLSQIMHIINSNAKGGIMAEVGAFVDPRKAQEEWAKADAVTMLKEGGILKVKDKTTGNYPSGIDRLMEFALNSLPQVTGINLEALGLAAREQAGVLEQQRKQAAYGLLAPMFNGLRLYRKLSGHVLLYFIQEYIADGRLIRISGPSGQMALPLTKDQQAITYDIIVDQAPDSPDSKAKTWETLQTIIPAMLKAQVPIPPMIFDYTPLPTSLAQQWKNYAIQNQRNVSPEQVKQAQQKMEQLASENQKLKMDRTADMMEMDLKAKQAQQEHQLEIERMNREFQLKTIEMDREFALKMKQMQMEFDLKTADFEQNIALSNAKTSAEIDNKRTQMQNDMRMKAAELGLQAEDNGEVSIKLDTADLTNVLQSVVQSNERSVASNENMQRALMAMMEQMSAPKEVVFEGGRPVGIRVKK